VRIASLNLNKRLRTEGARSRLLRWLHDREVSLILTQEPWTATTPEVPALNGFRPIGGNHLVFAWVNEGMAPPPCTILDSWWQRLEVGYVVVHNVYLDAYSQRRRATQLIELKNGLLCEGDRPVLVVGDFNLAPRPEDGLFNGMPSTFNSERDRVPFRELLAHNRLHDLTGASPGAEFTIVRRYNGRSSAFRCDLVLLSDYLAPTVTTAYDHAVRVGKHSFTDHSASLIELPVTLSEHNDWNGRLSPQEETTRTSGPASCQPHRTAMVRQQPSPFARRFAESPSRQGVRSVLDYGCGRGADVDFYRQAGFLADGYDPHPAFGWHMRPDGVYDLVTVMFVLNVLPDPWQRLQVLRDADRHLADGGRMLVVCRSPKAIEKHARRGQWPQHNDGYWSSASKGTFQRGISTEELMVLGCRAGLTPLPEDAQPATIVHATQALLTRVAR
jgi:Methyltransferase domain/Endonuclease/Exonuclease/phosphatase family